MSTFRISKRERPLKRSLLPQARLRREMAEFLELLETEKYIKSLTYTSADTVEVHLEDATYAINRSLEFLRPPTLRKNGELFNAYDAEYSPALSSAKWFLMLMTAAPQPQLA